MTASKLHITVSTDVPVRFVHRALADVFASDEAELAGQENVRSQTRKLGNQNASITLVVASWDTSRGAVKSSARLMTRRSTGETVLEYSQHGPGMTVTGIQSAVAKGAGSAITIRAEISGFSVGEYAKMLELELDIIVARARGLQAAELSEMHSPAARELAS